MRQVADLKEKTKCAIVIVNYNTRDLLLACLESIYANAGPKYKYDIYVVDNASTDSSVEAVKEKYPRVLILPQGKNLGFAKANNFALRVIDSEYTLLLNPDTIIVDNCLELLLDYMEQHEDIGAVGCKVVLPDGTLDKACKRGFPTPASSFWYLTGVSKLFPKVRRFGGYQLNYLDENEINEVDSLVGAFMLIRVKALDEVGLLDENFFMYGEDIDLCYRIRKAGWKVVYNPQVKIIHYKGAASGTKEKGAECKQVKKKSYKVIYEFHRSMILFYRKHYKGKYPALLRGIVYLGVGIRFLLVILKNDLRK